MNIGRADQLGSGVRNLYRYTKMYSGGEPELIEGDVFKTIVPLDLSTTQMGDKLVDKSKMGDKRVDMAEEFLKILRPYFDRNEWIDTSTACEIANKPPTTVKRYLKKLTELKILEARGANKNRQYRLCNSRSSSSKE